MSRALRVLRVIARLNVGGPARHVTILDDRLRRRGFETLLGYGEIGPGEASLEHLVGTTGIPARRVSGLGRRVSPLADVKALTELIGLVFRFRPDIVHTHTAKAGTLGRLAALLYNLSHRRRNRCLVVHTFHGHVLHGYFSAAMSLVVRAVERALGTVTDCVLVLSEKQRQDIACRYRIASPDKVHIVPLGLELDRLTALDAPAAADADGIVFGFVGRFVPIKNLPLLIDAFAKVRRELPGTRLLLVGDGESRAAVEGLVAQHGLTAAVEIAGWRDDLAAVYRDMDVLVLTSLNEGTPVAVIEAMAAALPVVAASATGSQSLVEDGVTGRLIRPGACDKFCEALAYYCRDEAARRAAGKAGCEVSQHYGWDEVNQSLVDSYLRIIRQHHEGGRQRPSPVP